MDEEGKRISERAHARDGRLLDRIFNKAKKLGGALKPSERLIVVDAHYLSTRSATRRAMRKELIAECKKVGTTYRQARRYMREELRMEPTLANMHREIVEVQS